jgi:23S rRNA (adenine2503-C2)-methyltransferase
MKTPINIKKDIRDLSFDELTEYIVQLKQQRFRAGQILDWIYKKGVQTFDEMTNLPLELKEKLKEDFILYEPEVLVKDVSKDGTIKTLFNLKDRQRVETVLIPTDTRATVCVSTQAGCKFGCKFCASGIAGWNRNLTPAEIIDQILYMKRLSKDVPLSNIVFMGVGEPLDNYDNLLKAIRVINAQDGLTIGARKITISTCGVIPKIQKLATEGMQLELAISLHGFDNESRNVLMPVNRKYPFDDLIEACREYIKATKRQITFEYILIKDVTCHPKAVQSLKKAFKGLICKMNLIPYNPVTEFDHKTPTQQEMIDFRNQLERIGVHATIRTPRGRDVSAACGQLRHSIK